MLVPSIDLMDGHAVQLIGGEERALDAGDPMPIAERFGRVGEVAVIDLDAALGRGSNADVIKSLLRSTRARVGGGIRSYEAAVEWLDAGAQKVILGTAARPELLARLPRERVIAALDARDGEVVVEGWQKRTGEALLGRIASCATMSAASSSPSSSARSFGRHRSRARPSGHRSGGDGARDDRGRCDHGRGDTGARCHRRGCPGRHGALHRPAVARRGVRSALAHRPGRRPVRDGRDGRAWPCVGTRLVEPGVVGPGDRCWKGRVPITIARSDLGQRRELRCDPGPLRVDLDCDRDVIRFVVRQHGEGFCHLGTPTCWGDVKGLTDLARTLGMRRTDAPAGSYTARLFADRALLDAKLREEAEELTQAQRPEDVVHEAADVLFFTLARLTAEGISLAQVEAELDRRALKVTRRE